MRILDGKHKGETGIVVKSETTPNGKIAFARVVLVQSNREIKVFTNNLKLKSDIEQTGGSISASDLIIDKSKACAYKAGDMIAYKNNMNVGIVLQIDAMGGISGDFIRIIND